MEARVDPENKWYLIMRIQDVNPDDEVVTTLNIISFKTKAEAQGFVGAFNKSTKQIKALNASYLIVNKDDFERIR